jgi:hypothetical protein
MKDGSVKEIQKITIGDETRGGVVTGVMQFAKPGHMYRINNTEVTGWHHVFDPTDGVWKPAGSVAGALRVETVTSDTGGVVYDFSCSEHRIFSGGMVYTDYEEHDVIPEIAQMELDLLNNPATSF